MQKWGHRDVQINVKKWQIIQYEANNEVLKRVLLTLVTSHFRHLGNKPDQSWPHKQWLSSAATVHILYSILVALIPTSQTDHYLLQSGTQREYLCLYLMFINLSFIGCLLQRKAIFYHTSTFSCNFTLTSILYFAYFHCLFYFVMSL